MTNHITIIGFECVDCQVNTSDINEYYMVKDTIWRKYGVGKGMLCISCLEKRMKRSLLKSDFTDCLLNRCGYFYQFPNRHKD